MPKTILALQEKKAHLESEAEEVKATDDIRKHAVAWADFATDFENDIADFTNADEQKTVILEIINGYKQSLRHLQTIKSAFLASDVKNFAEITTRLAKCYKEPSQRQLAIETYEAFIQENLSSALTGKIYFKCSRLYLMQLSETLRTENETVAVATEKKVEADSTPQLLLSTFSVETSTTAAADNKTRIDLALLAKSLMYLQKAAEEKHYPALTHLAQYYQITDSVHVEVAEALEEASKYKILSTKAKTLLALFKKNNAQHLQEVLLQGIQQKYATVLTYTADRDATLMEEFLHLLDEQGFPVDIKWPDSKDLFSYIYCQEAMPNKMKEQLISLLLSRGFQSPIASLFRPNLLSKENSEANFIEEAFDEKNNDLQALIKISTSYLGVDNTAGMHNLFFTRFNKRKHSGNDSISKKNRVVDRIEESEASQGNENALLSQSSSNVSTAILSLTKK